MYKFLRSKKGFTLVELVVVVAVMGILAAIAMPIYNYASGSSKKKVCRTEMKYVRTSVRTWAMENTFNSDFTFTIESDGEKATVQSSGTDSNVQTISASKIQSDIFDGDVPYCPGKGTYTITIKKNETKNIPDVTVTCNGGSGSNVHNY